MANDRHTDLRDDAGEKRLRVTDVVGAEDGLGVECLSGSGAIASVYARAFREGFTITLVSGRTVGIGAYLARLGRRCIQRVDQPVILTGFSALNKLLGREVYTSQLQLGGPKVRLRCAHHVRYCQTKYPVSLHDSRKNNRASQGAEVIQPLSRSQKKALPAPTAILHQKQQKHICHER